MCLKKRMLANNCAKTQAQHPVKSQLLNREARRESKTIKRTPLSPAKVLFKLIKQLQPACSSWLPLGVHVCKGSIVFGGREGVTIPTRSYNSLCEEAQGVRGPHGSPMGKKAA